MFSVERMSLSHIFRKNVPVTSSRENVRQLGSFCKMSHFISDGPYERTELLRHLEDELDCCMMRCRAHRQ